MGFLSSFIGEKTDIATSEKGNLSAVSGNHNIQKENVLQATNSKVFNPLNPGNFESIRSVPVLERPTYFTKEIASELTQMAREKEKAVKHTKKAVKALVKIDNCDTEVHRNYYRKYARSTANNEVSKLKASNSHAKNLHRLRPEYSAMGASLDKAENTADIAIQAIESSLR